jgi:hypothetical protein
VDKDYRLQGAPVISYSELRPKGEGKTAKKGEGIAARHAGRGGQVAEIYTSEHEKLLGSATEEWQLFADGYAANGNRVYDPVLGKTCHLCRYWSSLVIHYFFSHPPVPFLH